MNNKKLFWVEAYQQCGLDFVLCDVDDENANFFSVNWVVVGNNDRVQRYDYDDLVEAQIVMEAMQNAFAQGLAARSDT